MCVCVTPTHNIKHTYTRPGDVCFTDVDRKGGGIVEYVHEDVSCQVDSRKQKVAPGTVLSFGRSGWGACGTRFIDL